jgi:hypothetical protein
MLKNNVQIVAMPICELCDRLTIAKLKLQRLPAEELNKTLLRKQIAYYETGIDHNDPKICDLIAALLDINGQMWDAEHDIRKGLDDILGLAEIGKRAIKIRNLNCIRVAIKNKITMLAGQPEFSDCKMNHISQRSNNSDTTASPSV